MRPIPIKMRAELAEEPRMKVCVGEGLIEHDCSKKIEWDHVWIYAGKQINEKWAILSVCDVLHKMKEGSQLVREFLARTSLRLATYDDLQKYPRKNWLQIRRSLGLDEL